MRVWFIAETSFLVRTRNMSIKPARSFPILRVTHVFRVLPGDEVVAEVDEPALQEIRQKADILGIEP